MPENPANHFLERLTGRSMAPAEMTDRSVLRPRLPGRFEPSPGGVLPGSTAPVEEVVESMSASLGKLSAAAADPAASRTPDAVETIRSLPGATPEPAPEGMPFSQDDGLVSAQLRTDSPGAKHPLDEQKAGLAARSHPERPADPAGQAAGISSGELETLRQSLKDELQRQAAEAAAEAARQQLMYESQTGTMPPSIHSSAQPGGLQASVQPPSQQPGQVLRQSLGLGDQKTPDSITAPTPPDWAEPRLIVVSIGRVEVRAVAAPQKSPKSGAAAGQKYPAVMSLEEYLQRRGGAR